ncbi:MAG: acyl-CoA thioesterase [Myxococcota bacterium]|nr:acyl-CoA thioesterase [Myxococcota bacterium]
MNQPNHGHRCRISKVEMTELVLPQDTNYHGTVFGGRILQWIDIAGAIAAQRHARCKVVTASIDDMHFVMPIRLGDTVILYASVNSAHRTSMEVGIRVERELRGTMAREHAASAYLTFVAVNDGGQPIEIPSLIVETAEERRRQEDAQLRRQFRLKRREAILNRRGNENP